MSDVLLRRGAFIGFLFSILLLLSQPFQAVSGLIPELMKFFTSVPLWIAAMAFQAGVTPLVQGLAVMAYFIVAGALIGVSFELKAIWGWLLVIMLVIHHYNISESAALKLGEVVPTILSSFGWS
jgi:hypothetical protein